MKAIQKQISSAQTGNTETEISHRHRRNMLKALCYTPIFVIGSCCKVKEKHPSPIGSPASYGPKKTAHLDFLGKEWKEIRAFNYNSMGHTSKPLLRKINGELFVSAPECVPKGIRLSSSEGQKLERALKSNSHPYLSSKCYIPRHGFVFYGENGEILGAVEVCFECLVVKSIDKNLRKNELENFNLSVAWDLLIGLGKFPRPDVSKEEEGVIRT